MKLIFETERLLLRPFQESDAPFLYELNSDEEVMRYTGDFPFENIEAARLFAINYIENPESQYQKYNMGRLAVVRKEDQAFLGWTGLKYHEKENTVDTGYRLMKKYWGNGYATESTRRALQHAFEDHKLTQVIAHVHELNVSSQRVAQKLGMKIDHRFLWDGRYPARCYQITHEEFINT
ncbi:MAG: GNAT family N-acetyltransferase [Nonlabens sp.]|uniref:GNAT family N-acetyltransferase n=1 Tax=Nonlabens sp. TaxID=1888209 RepID=UPI003EF70AC5